ncbi:MAG: iron-containing alcohol dehydrogenase [Actinobacteria bacterium]|nr:iron-containing alcohol dehydrogenase [Actinomycetota bacterium]
MAEFPEVFVFNEDDEAAAAEELARVLRDMGVEAPFLLSSIHGRQVSAKVAGTGPVETPTGDADQEWAASLGARAREAGADAVVAVGGGRCLDIGKLAAARAGVNVIAVPTQLSHDGICSPVAVVPDADGRPESLGAIAPRAVFMSMVTLFGAPPRSIAAGVGDLLANPLALKDWQLAAGRGLEQLDDRAWDLSAQSYDLIRGRLDEDPATWSKDLDALRNLADALVLSGMAMIASGTSRPASGGEHEISHAIDELFGGRALHGAQVAFGCIITTALYDGDVDGLRATLRRLDLPDEPSKLGLDADELRRVVLAAPNTRPGRFTIIEDANLSDAEVSRLIADIWS